MMREVPLDNDEAEAVLRKLLAEMSNIQLQELPPLVYQMLLLAAKVDTVNFTFTKCFLYRIIYTVFTTGGYNSILIYFLLYVDYCLNDFLCIIT